MRYFFIFSYCDPSKAHVVRGEDRHTLEVVRALIKSGAQISQLHYLSKVIEGTHFERNQNQPMTDEERVLVDYLQAEVDTAAAELRLQGGTLPAFLRRQAPADPPIGHGVGAANGSETPALAPGCERQRSAIR